MNTRSRPIWILPLVLVLLGGILGSCQNAAAKKGRVDVVSQLVAWPVRRVAIPLDWFGQTVSDLIIGIVQAPSLRRKVESLEEQLAKAKQTPDRTLRLEQEITRLNSLLNMPPIPGHKEVSIRLIAYFPEEHKMQFAGGSYLGITAGDPVVHAAGLVGQVTSVSADSCYVALVTHPKFSVGVRIARSTSQEVGLLRGRGDALMVLDLATSDADAQAQDKLITGGLSKTYPEGIEVGKITQAWVDKTSGSKQAYVRPAVNFYKIREARVIIR